MGFFLACISFKDTLSKLFHTDVVPSRDYCCGIWDFHKFGYLDAVRKKKKKPSRFVQGVHRFSPNLAINSDERWEDTHWGFSGVKIKGEFRTICQKLSDWIKGLDFSSACHKFLDFHLMSWRRHPLSRLDVCLFILSGLTQLIHFFLIEKADTGYILQLSTSQNRALVLVV